MEIHKKFTYHAGIVSLGIFLSRILGYIRDLLLAYFFSKELRGIFFACFLIPNMIRTLFGEGALTSSFIPVFIKYLKKEKASAWYLGSCVLNLLFIISLSLVVIGIIFAPLISSIIAPGFIKLGLIPLMSNTLRIIFPYLIFVCISAFISGILNSLGRFGPPSIAPSLLNISFIVFIIIGRGESLFWLEIAVLIGGILQILFQIPFLLKENFQYKPVIDLSHPGVKEVFIKMLPFLLGAAVYQINISIDTIMASLIGPSAVSSLYYANRLINFPLALFGISLAIVSLPSISKYIAENNMEDAKKIINKALRIILVITPPVIVGFLILGKEIISFLFEHGKFTSDETASCYLALFFYSFGIIPFCAIKPVVSFFYSLQDMKTPLKTSSFCMVLNIFLNLLFVKPLEEGGLALATSMSGWINLYILTIFLKKRIGGFGEGLLKTFAKSSILSILMGIFLMGFIKIGLSTIFNVFFGIIFSLIFYFSLSKIFRII